MVLITALECAMHAYSVKGPPLIHAKELEEPGKLHQL